MLSVWAHWGENRMGFRPSERSLLKPQPLGQGLVQALGSPLGDVVGLAPCEMPNSSFQPSFAQAQHPLACLNGKPCPGGAQRGPCLGAKSREVAAEMGCLPLLPSDWPHSSPAPLALGAWEHAQLQTPKCLSWQVESVNKPLGEETGARHRPGSGPGVGNSGWGRGDFSITGGIKAGARLCAGMPKRGWR